MLTESFELKFLDWLAKFNEKITFARLKINDRKEISEDEENLLKVMFKVYENGEYPIYAVRMKPTDVLAVDQGLFEGLLADNSDGTVVVIDKQNQKGKKK